MPVRLPPTIDSHSFVHAYVDSGTNNATSASDLKVTGKCSVKSAPTPHHSLQTVFRPSLLQYALLRLVLGQFVNLGIHNLWTPIKRFENMR